MIRRPPRSTLLTHSFPTRRASDLRSRSWKAQGMPCQASAGLLSRAQSGDVPIQRSEEHTSELQSLMRISYAVFCLKKKKAVKKQNTRRTHVKNQINNTQLI